MGICFPYLGEFQPTKYREKILCWMELFWTLGIIVLPGIAWLIIPLEINIRTPTFIFGSWNLFVAICALPSILLSFWLFLFPESPKFLIECHENDAALQVLKHIYEMNTGNESSEYPVKMLREKEKPIIRKRRLVQEVWQQTKSLFYEPHLKNIILSCLIQFGLTTRYCRLL